MTTTQTEIESQIIELSTKALGSFCDDISQMFSVNMSCKPLEPCAETVKGLGKKYKKLAAVISVKSEGALKGNFQFIFDKIGLFTLSGVIVMLPEERILKAGKYGSDEEAENMSDTFGEAGNLLVGSWDRLFREELESHGHFAQLNTFIGNPWNKPEEKIGLDRNEELLFIRHEITIGSYPPFRCGIIFPKRIFADISEPDTGATDNIEKKDEEETEEKAQEQQVTTQQTEPEESVEDRKTEAVESESQDSTAEKDEQKTEEKTQEQQATTGKTEPEESVEDPKTDAVESESQDSTAEKAEEEPESEKAVDEKETVAEEHPEAIADTKIDAEEADVFSGEVKAEAVSINETCQSQMGPVSKTIKRMTAPQGNPPGEFGQTAWAICASDIMRKEVLWANADDSVQQALEKIDKAGTGYLLIGTGGVIEGVVSKSDLAGAMSPYLRPMFAKWRRPLDDATLKIRIKWIMSRLVRTVNAETPLPEIIQNMCQHDGHCCLPVVDNNGKVQGMITTFDIYSTLLKTVSG
ncbi:MAG: CBS domain-containing protein [Planctomycetota bacterium]|jgi:CBS domain-containing protein